MRISVLSLVFYFALIGAASAEFAFSVPLGGDQEVPPVTTEASGHCLGVLSEDMTSFTITCAHDVAEPSAAHIHDAPASENGGVIFPFDSAESPISQTFAFDADNVETLLEGEFYVNVHTAANPGGEIRGQIIGPAEKSLSFDLSGSQEVPPVATAASGHCFAALDDGTLAVSCTHDVEGASAAHVHDANAGISGGVLLPFGSPASPIFGEFDVSDEQVAKLRAQNLYVNVHSPTNPGGELRGQMVDDADTAFHFVLSGVQEAPIVDTEAGGQCTAVLNASETELAVSCNHTVQDPSASHIHDAPAGTSGGVLLPFSSAASPIIEILQVSAANVDLLKARGLYVNVHSPTHPGGEVRGQINRTPDGTYAGTYYDPARDGEGILLEISGESPTIVVSWYSYAPGDDGQQIFLIGSAAVVNNQAVVPLVITSGAEFGDEFDPLDVIRTEWGTLTITFVSCTRVIVEYSSDLPGYGDGVLTQVRLTSALTGVGTCS